MTITGRNLSCVRGGRAVFGGLDFDIPAGSALLLRGPNGSGKSSLLLMAAGFLEPEAGQLKWDGADFTPGDHGSRITWVGHLDAVKPAFSVRENLSFWLRLQKGSGIVEPALQTLGIGHLADLPAGFLSLGQRRRLNLARLSASQAPLWLLDEPATSLDEEAVEQLLAILSGHLARGGMAMIATHVDLPLASGSSLMLGGSSS